MKKLFITGLLLLFTSNVNAAEHLIPSESVHGYYVMKITEHFKRDKLDDNVVVLPNGLESYKFEVFGISNTYLYEPTENKIYVLKDVDNTPFILLVEHNDSDYVDKIKNILKIAYNK